ncbi:hypothetical protein R1sor_010341 [Riccia sorocarpa]|uniref:DNA methylase N-4/N-6 domain-containing protein n=1 Tax=Riccia sorocarpa TaxID=122646 RepID=A0ABD3I1A9_9MARC
MILPGPILRPFLVTDFHATWKHMLAEEAKRKQNRSHLRKPPSILENLAALCSRVQRPPMKGFKILGATRKFAADCIVIDPPTDERTNADETETPAWNKLDPDLLESYFKFATNVLDDRGCILLFHSGSIRHSQLLMDTLDNFPEERGFQILKSIFVCTYQSGFTTSLNGNLEMMWISKAEILIRKGQKPMPIPKMQSNGKLVMPNWSPIDGNFCYNDLNTQPLGKGQLGSRRRTVDLMQTLFELITKPGEVILDCNLGYGASFLAAYNCGRYVCGMENRAKDIVDSCKKVVLQFESLHVPPEGRGKDVPKVADKKGKKPVLEEDCEALFDFDGFEDNNIQSLSESDTSA